MQWGSGLQGKALKNAEMDDRRGQLRAGRVCFWGLVTRSPSRVGGLQRRLGVRSMGSGVYLTAQGRPPGHCHPKTSTDNPHGWNAALPRHTSWTNKPAARGEWERKQTTNQEPRGATGAHALSSGAAAERRGGEGSLSFFFAAASLPIAASPAWETQG